MSEETFSTIQVGLAIKQFLDYGEQEFQKSQQGSFSGGGWAARCLRYHLGQVDSQAAKIERLRRDLADATDPKPIGLVVQQTKALVDERDRLRAALIAVIERAEYKTGSRVSDDVCEIARMALGPNVADNRRR